MPDLAFVLSPRQNHFFVELVEVIRDELEAIGVRSQVRVGEFPQPRPGLVNVLLPPHEYFAAREGAEPPDPALMRRTIFICAEQPASIWFEDNALLVRQAGAVFDISKSAVREWSRRGLEVEHFLLGYTRRWDRSPFDSPRDVDVAFLGARSERRERYLSRYAGSLWRWRSHLVLSDNGRPNEASGPDFLAGDDKRDLLGQTRVLLNLHSGNRPYFESLRVVEAILSGAVVVSEHSPDFAPFTSGVDFIGAQPDNLMFVAQHLLEHEDERRAHAERALAHLRDEIPLRRSVERLAAAAEAVEAQAPAATAVRTPPVLPARPEPFEFPPPLAATDDPENAQLRRTLKQAKLDSILDRRRIDRVEALLDGAGSTDLEVAATTPAYAGVEPVVSVIVSLYNYENEISAALESASVSGLRELELVVVDDASTDGSLGRVLDWCERNPGTPSIVLHRHVNGGLARARNAGLDFAQGEFVFILDADNEIYPHGLQRLVEALAADPEAAFAYGICERFDGERSTGLLSVGGWEPRRLRHVNYIDAMAMIRRDALRTLEGYTDDVRLYGWEDYDLWCKVAERGWRGHVVREILGRYRVSDDSMLGSVTNLSSTDAYVALVERHPRLMAGVEPPL